MLEYGMKVRNKLTGQIAEVNFSIFGYSLHYRSEDGGLCKTIGEPEHQVLKYWEVIEEQDDTHE